MSDLERVVVDTSIWIDFFNRPGSEGQREVDRLLAADRVVIAGVILAELLQGAKSKRDFERLSRALTALPYLQEGLTTWQEVGRLSLELRKRGLTIPLTDLLIAVLAVENDCQIYTRDSHFKLIPGARLHGP